MRTFGVIFPRELAPTVGPTHKSVEIQEGARHRPEGTVVDWMTRSRNNKPYVDTAAWDPETDSAEPGYWVTIRSSHLFMSRDGGPEPEPGRDAPTKHMSRSPNQTANFFVGFIA